MAIADTDIVYRLSGGAANTDPALSLGGARSTAGGGIITSAALHNLFDVISGDEAAGAARTEYRCIYVGNTHGSLTWLAPKVWISVQTTSGDTDLAIALGGEGVNGTAETVANETTAPTGETFSAPTTKSGGLSVADVPAGQWFPLWVRRVKNSAAAAANDTSTLRAEGDSNP
jgi:hypothetical protein